MRMKKIDDTFLTLPEKFSAIENLTFHEYWKPAIGYTWTNTGGMSHVPNTNCYHPYDSPNYGKYEKSATEKEKQAPFIYAKNIDNKDFIKGCDQVELNPHSLSFISHKKPVDSLFIQTTTYKSTRLKINNQDSKINIVRGQVCITRLDPESKVEICFLPSGLIALVILSILSFCCFGIYCLVYKLRVGKTKILD